MKKILMPVLALMPMGANALTLQGCSTATCPTSTSTIVYDVPHPACDSYTTKCLYNSSNGYYLRYSSCSSCDSPYESITEQLSSFAAFTTVCGSNSVSLTTRTNCSCGTKCDSCGAGITPTWGPTATVGYQVMTEFSCGLATGCECTKTTKYRCAAGYYGTATYLQSTLQYKGCTRCPLSGDVYGTCAAGNGTAITSCYIPTTSTLTDDTGAYQYTSNCYYTK